MNWPILALIIYLAVLIVVCLRILYETQSTNKTVAYLLFSIFIPVVGMAFYLTFGINYWHRKRYNKKLKMDAEMIERLKKEVQSYNKVSLKAGDDAVEQNGELTNMLIRDLGSPLTGNNSVQLLVNGEEKFPDLMRSIQKARYHIHMEYYIFECDETGSAIIEQLIQKATEGVEVRFIYDDFGSPTIKKATERRMKAAGIEVHPFHKVLFYMLANRINYRNHRKIVVIDGCIGYVGGINISQRYANIPPVKLFWRDTHLRLEGPAVYYLQYIFLADWNFCCDKKLHPHEGFFRHVNVPEKVFAQIAASGPDSVQPSILYAVLQTIYLAKKEIFITTPYFIPGDSVIEALCIAALSGLDVKLLVPGKCDSRLVNAASQSYYSQLLEAGVEVYLYQKGFVHAKTIVTDGQLSMVGTANMDYRSFELNFEVNAVVYDKKIAGQLRELFFDDLEHSTKIDKEEWLNRSSYKQFPEKLARLFSPVL